MHGAYLRISTDEQNLDTQRGVIADWLTAKGLKAEWFEDKGYSGDTVRRPAFTAMRKEKGLETIVVFRLDRISRKTATGINLLHGWLKSGIRVVSVMEGIDLDPSDPEMSGVIVDIIVPLLFGLAANEQRVRRQRQSKGIERAKREGKYTGRKPGATKVKREDVQRYESRGWTDNEIARQLKVTRRTIVRYRNGK
jgi:DNA invertase Pin-like site-specific DNA recombinase